MEVCKADNLLQIKLHLGMYDMYTQGFSTLMCVYVTDTKLWFVTAHCMHNPAPEEVGNGAISDHGVWVWSKFIHSVRHSRWIGTVAEELRRIQL